MLWRFLCLLVVFSLIVAQDVPPGDVPCGYNCTINAEVYADCLTSECIAHGIACYSDETCAKRLSVFFVEFLVYKSDWENPLTANLLECSDEKCDSEHALERDMLDASTAAATTDRGISTTAFLATCIRVEVVSIFHRQDYQCGPGLNTIPKLEYVNEDSEVGVILSLNNFPVLSRAFLAPLVPENTSKHSVVMIRLSAAKISAIENDSFAEFPRLDKLYMDINPLGKITREAFSSATSLQQLFLDRTELTIIEEGAFSTLSRLELLELRSNRLSEVTGKTLQGLAGLRFLGLAHNLLTNLAEDVFDSTPALESLDLTNNLIRKASSRVLQQLVNLTDIGFSGNALTDCFVGGTDARNKIGDDKSFVCLGCRSGVEVEVFGHLRSCPTFKLMPNVTTCCGAHLESYQRRLLGSLALSAATNCSREYETMSHLPRREHILYFGESMEFAGWICKRENLFVDWTNLVNGAEVSSATITFAPRLSVDGDVAVLRFVNVFVNDRDGAVQVAVEEASSRTPPLIKFNATIVAQDAGGASIELGRAAFLVTSRPDFRLRADGCGEASFVKAVEQIAEVIAVDEPLSVSGLETGCSRENAFEHFASNDADQIAFVAQLFPLENEVSSSVAEDDIFVDSETGRLTLTLRTAGDFGARNVSLTAKDGNGRTTHIAHWTVKAMPHDTEDDGNGPGGRGCDNGDPVDSIPFDQSFTCDCLSTYSGANCDRSDVLLGIAVAFAVVVIFIVIPAVVVMYRARKRKMQPYDFEKLVEELRVKGELQNKKAQGNVPREIKRACITKTYRLGGGAFGDVYLAMLDESRVGGVPGYLVALKEASASGASKACAMEELMTESTIMAQVGGHEHIVSLVGVVTVGEPVMVLMTYCEHGSLLSVLRQQQIKWPRGGVMTRNERSKACLDVARGMAHLVECAIVHRDLAARNVLVDSMGKCRVADFGLSRATKTSNEENSQELYYRSANGLFAVRWTAPEAMESLLFSEGSDVWSYGILLHEIYSCGDKPYKDMDNREILGKLMDGYRLPQAQLCPDSIYNLMQRTWNAAPQKRPSFKHICIDLEEQSAQGELDRLQPFETYGDLQKEGMEFRSLTQSSSQKGTLGEDTFGDYTKTSKLSYYEYMLPTGTKKGNSPISNHYGVPVKRETNYGGSHEAAKKASPSVLHYGRKLSQASFSQSQQNNRYIENLEEDTKDVSGRNSYSSVGPTSNGYVKTPRSSTFSINIVPDKSNPTVLVTSSSPEPGDYSILSSTSL
eukprot:m.250880 g.250880  ORF g.250880 m.250880 type:complete len:1254 (+) comp16142_c0_seq18:358-4119(+)